MNKIITMSKVRDFFMSSQAYKTAGFILFTFLLTAIIASQNFFFQSIVDGDILVLNVFLKTKLKISNTGHNITKITNKFSVRFFVSIFFFFVTSACTFSIIAPFIFL